MKKIKWVLFGETRIIWWFVAISIIVSILSYGAIAAALIKYLFSK